MSIVGKNIERRLRVNGLLVVSILFFVYTGVLQAAEKKINIRTAPISDMIGISNVDLDIAIGEKISLGPTYSSYHLEISDVSLSNTLYGLRLNYYLNRRALQGGWMASFNASFGDLEISETRNTDGVRFSVISSLRIYTGLIGYQGMWNSFNMSFGIGASYFSLPDSTPAVNGVETYTIDTGFISGVLPSAEFSVGWRF